MVFGGDVGALLARNANNGANAGFGYLNANNRSSNANANTGFRLYRYKNIVYNFLYAAKTTPHGEKMNFVRKQC